MKNNIRTIFLVMSIITFLAIVGGIAIYNYLLTPISTSAVEIKFKVQSGATLRTVANDLEDQGIIRLGHIFYLYGRIHSTNLQAGIFDVSGAMSVQELSKIFESGRFESIRVSIPEGLTVSQIGRLLELNEVTTLTDFIEASKNETLLAEFNIPSTNFEGYLFPDTYNFDPDMSGVDVIRIMASNFYNKISEISLLENLNAEELFQTLILASIVEREYRVADEAPIIASVFENRLEHNIGLYSCATLVYVITEILDRPHPEIITYDDTDIDSPYNTYKWAGLTPTPISNPGMVALNAAANPADTNYYYFRLIDPAIGNHIFTSDFDDHIEAGISIQTKGAAY